MTENDPETNRFPPIVGVSEWEKSMPWLVHGTTTRGQDDDPFDLRLHGPASSEAVLGRWESLRHALAAEGVVVSRQVHGSTLRVHEGGISGLLLAPPADGHLTGAVGLLLAVTLADCVPVFVVAPEARVVGLVHAGWRGTAAGIVERAIGAFGERYGLGPDALRMHLGPAIGGASYEVGPEVFRALGRPVPDGPEPLDLRGVIAERAVDAGVHPDEISRSSVDTLHDPSYFSHRRGDTGRHIAFLGIRSPADPVS